MEFENLDLSNSGTQKLRNPETKLPNLKHQTSNPMNTSRRDFIITSSMASAALATGCASTPAVGSFRVQGEKRAVLLHLGNNMWGSVQTKMSLSEPHFERAVAHMPEAGLNTLVLDLGEGMRYESHPELAIEGSWSAGKVRDFIRRANGLGVEVVPKLNFSACHDAWLGEYHRMVSTPEYYKVVADVIRDTCEIFGRPRLFHLGMDEELMGTQKRCAYQCIRQGELLWHDYYYYFTCLSEHGVRPLVWGDEATFHKEQFYQRMPKYVLQSKCHYGSNFEKGKQKDQFHEDQLASLQEVSDAGYEQLPVSSNWVMKKAETFPWPTGKDYLRDRTAIGLFTKYCAEHIKPELLAGMLVAPWGEINEPSADYWLEAIDQQADAMRDCGLTVA